MSLRKTLKRMAGIALALSGKRQAVDDIGAAIGEIGGKKARKIIKKVGDQVD